MEIKHKQEKINVGSLLSISPVRHREYLVEFMEACRARAKRHPRWSADLDEVPILHGEAIAAYLGARPTNFPKIFFVEGRVIGLRDTSKEGIALAASVLPYTYFQIYEAERYVMYGMRLSSEAVPNSTLMHASFYYATLPGPRRDEEQRDRPPTRMLVSYQDGELNFSAGAGADPRCCEIDGEKYEMSVGSSPDQVFPSKAVREWARAVFSPDVWVERDMTDLNVYHEGQYSQIAAEHKETVEMILDHVPDSTYLIVPGDGEGRVASLWKGEGAFGDPVITPGTNSRVLQERAEETIERGIQEAGERQILMLCIYISPFFHDQPDIPTLWVDHDGIMDRNPKIRRVSEALFAYKVDPEIWAHLDRWGRRRWRPYRVPYSENLREQRVLDIPRLSRVALEALRNPDLTAFVPSTIYQYVRHMGAACVPYGGLNRIRQPPEEVPTLAISVTDMLGKKSAYFVPFGRELTLENVILHTARAPVLYSRTLYYVPASLEYLVPQRAWRETIWDQIYFGMFDEQTTVAHVRYSAGSSYLTMQYTVRPYHANVGWVPDRIWDQLRGGETEEEVRSLLYETGEYNPEVIAEVSRNLVDATVRDATFQALRARDYEMNELFQAIGAREKGVSKTSFKKMLKRYEGVYWRKSGRVWTGVG